MQYQAEAKSHLNLELLLTQSHPTIQNTKCYKVNVCSLQRGPIVHSLIHHFGTACYQGCQLCCSLHRIAPYLKMKQHKFKTLSCLQRQRRQVEFEASYPQISSLTGSDVNLLRIYVTLGWFQPLDRPRGRRPWWQNFPRPARHMGEHHKGSQCRT